MIIIIKEVQQTNKILIVDANYLNALFQTKVEKTDDWQSMIKQKRKENKKKKGSHKCHTNVTIETEKIQQQKKSLHQNMNEAYLEKLKKWFQSQE